MSISINLRVLSPIAAILISFLSSCGSSSVDESYQFEYKVIPSVINDDAGRIEYLSARFWDNIPWNDTNIVIKIVQLQKPFADYLQILSSGSLSSAAESLGKLAEQCANSSRNIQEPFTELFEQSLYDPNSSYKNEELYIRVAEGFLRGKNLIPGARERFNFQLTTLRKNRIGTISEDFTIITSKGREINLHSFVSPYTLLFFYEPECKSCNTDKEYITDSKVFLNAGKIIKIVAVYTGTDLAVWEAHSGTFPENWEVGHDKENMIVNESIYDRRASPSIYILDKNKKVILKDANAYEAEAFIAENIIKQPLQ